MTRTAMLVAALFATAYAGDAYGQLVSPPPRKDIRMTKRASGTFDVKLTPQPAADSASGLGRMAIDKQFHGDLEASSKGEMLAAMTRVENSAGYVALEHVTGSLAGRRGAFSLQHYGIMNRGKPTLTVSVVPDSGTDQLTGLTGTMTIDITGGKHLYTFEYQLPDAR
jgi:hypothetical protein